MPDTALMPRIQNSDRSMSTSSGLRASDKIQVSMQCLQGSQLQQQALLVSVCLSYGESAVHFEVCCHACGVGIRP